MRKILRFFRFIKFLVVLIAIGIALTLGINFYVVHSAEKNIVSADEAAAWAKEGGGADAILVLGAAVYGSEPSPILADRLDTAFYVFLQGGSDILLFSGDNGQIEYNEVQAMKNYALENGLPYGIADANIYLDYAGFSTYDSLYRAKNVFCAEKIIVITQEYHLYRAVYIGKKLGLDIRGVAVSDEFTGRTSMEDISEASLEAGDMVVAGGGNTLFSKIHMLFSRETAARVKDFFFVLTKRVPDVLGDEVPLIYPSTQATEF